VIHSRVNDGIDERGQRIRIKRPPDTPELTKSVKAARADTRDVAIDAQARTVKPIWILLKQERVGGSGIS